MSATVKPMSPSIGAEIQGVSLSELQASEVMQDIERAWYDHLVVLLRNQAIEDADLVRFSRHFGELDPAPINEADKASHGYAPELPEVSIISNVVADGVPIGALGSGEAEWHTDMSYKEKPPSASVLYSLEVPESGGDTSFLNMYAAYDELEPGLKEQIAGLTCVHDSSYTSTGDLRKGFKPVTNAAEAPGARHPLVILHPVTGRKALYLGRRKNAYVVGLPPEESDNLLEALWKHTLQERFTVTHKWRKGDVLIWDNRCTMHRREDFDPDSRRIMHRTQVRADVTFAAAS